MTFLLSATVFASALLLFWIQPLFAKGLLPLLGGNPSVWNTCLFFYQAALFCGYLFVHLMARRAHHGTHLGVHAGVLVLAALALPVALPDGLPAYAQAHPVLWLLLTLTLTIGPPFFVLSCTAPLVQRWFSLTGRAGSGDPYFLYAASNAGSIAALLGFVVVMEPSVGLGAQLGLWSLGYAVFAVLLLASMYALFTRRAHAGAPAAEPALTLAWLTPHARARVLLFSFIPASLLYGVTAHLTQNAASTPLFWVVPLVLYLLTFVLCFARREVFPAGLWRGLLPVLLLAYAALYYWIIDVNMLPFAYLAGFHLLLFVVVAMVFHGALARLRPHAGHLTEFYLLVSFGGILGGAFNALLAPVLFTDVLEYPIALGLAAVARALLPEARRRAFALADALVPAATLGALYAVGVMLKTGEGVQAQMMLRLVSTAVVLAQLASLGRPLRFGLGVCVVLVAAMGVRSAENVLAHERDFYGMYRVTYTPEEQVVSLFHGTILHGAQSRVPGQTGEPLTYYLRTGPVHYLFEGNPFVPGNPAVSRVAVVGLGAGAMAAYGHEGEQWDFFEISPIVARLAREQFTYLADTPAMVRVKIGDGRLSMAAAPPAHYDRIVVDTYNSDSIPLHMGTREAMALYRSRLAPGGVIAFHVSNLYLRLAPVLAHTARASGLRCIYCRTSSEWLFLAPDPGSLDYLLAHDDCTEVADVSGAPVWTDDYSSVFGVLVSGLR